MFWNKIYHHTSENMHHIPDESIHLVVTSPPYNVGKEYEDDMSLDEWREFLKRVWRESYRVLKVGGRICVNVANINRKPYVPNAALLMVDLMEIGFVPMGEVIWWKGVAGKGLTSWGSWMSPSLPYLRDDHEYILVLGKPNEDGEIVPLPKEPGCEPTISRDEFMEFTRSMWKMPAAKKTKIGHPAPFPVELPYRCIQLYTYSNNIVLDPFMGSGTTAIAAIKTGRRWVGYEKEKKYIDLAMRRIRAEVGLLELMQNGGIT